VTDFVDHVVEGGGIDQVLPLAEWDGRVTSAIIDMGHRRELLWLVWDFAPNFEVWLRGELSHDQSEMLLASGAGDIAHVLTASPTSAALIVFDLGRCATERHLLEVQWKANMPAQDLAVAVVRDLTSQAQLLVNEHAEDQIGERLAEVVASLRSLSLSPA
jgi:hypothetical protein